MTGVLFIWFVVQLDIVNVGRRAGLGVYDLVSLATWSELVECLTWVHEARLEFTQVEAGISIAQPGPCSSASARGSLAALGTHDSHTVKHVHTLLPSSSLITSPEPTPPFGRRCSPIRVACSMARVYNEAM